MSVNIYPILLFLLCLSLIFGYTLYRDYHKYQSQEGVDKVTKILNILNCPVRIFSNIPKCAAYYSRDKLFELIWFIIWIINFIIIFIPIFILDKIVCLIFKVCYNVSPSDVCISKKTFFRIFENIYYLFSGGNRYLHRNTSDLKKCYCSPPLIFLFDPLRKFRSYFEQMFPKSSPSFMALLIPIFILIVLVFRQNQNQK